MGYFFLGGGGGIFRQLRMTFLHKIMVAEKSNFSSNA